MNGRVEREYRIQLPIAPKFARGRRRTSADHSGTAVAGTDTGGGAPASGEAAASGEGQTVTGTDTAGGKAESGDVKVSNGGEAVAEEPETVEQAPLKASKTSVIIRRGDTLWQISRRIYGKGVRYTTIYLANEDQITDPDRIIPGQIFGVPDKAAETDAEAEALHRKHVRGN